MVKLTIKLIFVGALAIIVESLRRCLDRHALFSVFASSMTLKQFANPITFSKFLTFPIIYVISDIYVTIIEATNFFHIFCVIIDCIIFTIYVVNNLSLITVGFFAQA